jgi:hypothetical protein
MPPIRYAAAWPLLLLCFVLFLALVLVVAGHISRMRSKSQRDWQDRD